MKYTNKGFNNMSPEMRKSIAAKGGKKSWVLGNAHKWTPEEARAAGKKGGRKRKNMVI